MYTCLYAYIVKLSFHFVGVKESKTVTSEWLPRHFAQTDFPLVQWRFACARLVDLYRLSCVYLPALTATNGANTSQASGTDVYNQWGYVVGYVVSYVCVVLYALIILCDYHIIDRSVSPSWTQKFGGSQRCVYPDSKVHGANMGPTGSCRPQMGPCWPHEPCYQGTDGAAPLGPETSAGTVIITSINVAWLILRADACKMDIFKEIILLPIWTD